MDKDTAQNIRIVLVGPQSAGNIGSCARAMMNSGFSRLVLVNPVDFCNDEAFSMACNAFDVLRRSEVHVDMKAALKGSKLIVGTTRRKGKSRYPLLAMDEAVPHIRDLAAKNEVSILFGREDRGLKNEELAFCDMIFSIPASREYPSLNLSHAVFLVCYCISNKEYTDILTVEAASRDEVDNMFSHLDAVLRKLGYGRKGKEFLLRNIMRSMRRLLGRTRLVEKEVAMLRGILTSIENNMKKVGP
ncbi:MAG: RNA methyltransferase [Deltaproteobacteria bacterium]|nr:RNA methyltransferase [Deltaproteobacteria bacterium]